MVDIFSLLWAWGRISWRVRPGAPEQIGGGDHGAQDHRQDPAEHDACDVGFGEQKNPNKWRLNAVKWLDSSH